VGVGKQRLAAEIGRVDAWRVNRALQALCLREAVDARWRTILCAAPDEATRLRLPGVWPRGAALRQAQGSAGAPSIARIAQGEGDLGARLARVLKARRHVAVIGSDCPGATRGEIAKAFAALKRAPFALGPTHDGGFWILAARDGAAAAQAMEGVRWSSAHACEDVARNLGGRAAMLTTLRDVDVAADLRAAFQRPARRASSGS
jgi:glycosyltransferase A (GT-A) superfamily protein (DUF2064 family)